MLIAVTRSAELVGDIGDEIGSNGLETAQIRDVVKYSNEAALFMR